MENVLKKIEYIYNQLNRSQKFFALGAIFGICTFFWYLTPFKSIYFTSLCALGLVLLLGVISDFLFIYNKVWDTTIGKSLFVLLYVFLTTLTYAVADQIVNSIVAFDSSGLNRTSTFVSILLTPLVILIVTSIIFFLFLILGQFYLLFITYIKDMKSDKFLSNFIPNITEEYPGWSCVARFIIYPCVLGFLLGLGQIFGFTYQNFVLNQTRAFIYNFEAKKFSRCETPAGSKVITVSDKEIILVAKVNEAYKFTPSLCEPILKDDKS